MEEIPPRDVIFLKKKLLILIAQVLVISCLAGCERVPYWPTPWDTLCRILPRIQEMTDVSLQIEFVFTYNEKQHRPPEDQCCSMNFMYSLYSQEFG